MGLRHSFSAHLGKRILKVLTGFDNQLDRFYLEIRDSRISDEDIENNTIELGLLHYDSDAIEANGLTWGGVYANLMASGIAPPTGLMTELKDNQVNRVEGNHFRNWDEQRADDKAKVIYVEPVVYTTTEPPVLGPDPEEPGISEREAKLRFIKQRALTEARVTGRPHEQRVSLAIASLQSDFMKYPQWFQAAARIVNTLSMMKVVAGHLDTQEKLESEILGFN